MNVISNSIRIYFAFLLFLCASVFSSSSVALPYPPSFGPVTPYSPELVRDFYIDGQLEFIIPTTNDSIGGASYIVGFSTLQELLERTEERILYRLNNASWLYHEFDSCLSPSGYFDDWSGYKFAQYNYFNPPVLNVYTYCNVVGGSEPYSFPVEIVGSFLACSPNAESPDSCLPEPPVMCADGLPENLLGYYKCDRPLLKECENGAIILKSSFCPISETGEFPADTESPVLCRDFYSCLEYAESSFQCSVGDKFNFDYQDPLNWSVYCESECKWDTVSVFAEDGKTCLRGEAGAEERSSNSIVSAIERIGSMLSDWTTFDGETIVGADDIDLNTEPELSGLLSDFEIDYNLFDSGVPDNAVCPAPIPLNIVFLNRVIYIEYTLFCDFLTFIRPLIIAGAYLLSAMIMIGGVRRG